MVPHRVSIPGPSNLWRVAARLAEIRICCFLYQVVTSVQIVVQRVIKRCCRLDLIKNEFFCLFAGYFNPFSGMDILSPFSGSAQRKLDGWSPYVRQLYREASRLLNVAV
jgi:hypothetical protein